MVLGEVRSPKLCTAVAISRARSTDTLLSSQRASQRTSHEPSAFCRVGMGYKQKQTGVSSDGPRVSSNSTKAFRRMDYKQKKRGVPSHGLQAEVRHFVAGVTSRSSHFGHRTGYKQKWRGVSSQGLQEAASHPAIKLARFVGWVTNRSSEAFRRLGFKQKRRGVSSDGLRRNQRAKKKNCQRSGVTERRRYCC